MFRNWSGWSKRVASERRLRRPRANRKCASYPRLASGESRLCFPLGGGLGRAVTLSLARGWPRASYDYVSRPRVASGEFMTKVSYLGLASGVA
jgi:hypothetical protein